MTKRSFGELELAILSVLKKEGRTTVKEVHKILGEENKYTTIMTVMKRLAEKKVLGRERVGLQYEYWILTNTDKIPSFLQQIKQKIFGTKTSALVSYLIESADDITDEELAEIEKLIKKAQKQRRENE